MEKSNGTLDESPHTVNGWDLSIIGRRLFISKRFFAWVATCYFGLSLVASGGILSEFLVPLAKASKVVFYFATSTLLYSLIAYGLVTYGGWFSKIRLPILGIISILFVIAVARSFGLF